jgi:flavin reductase (DIM6/NTAB) family NADH-FMN oxidoreductase RutF
MLIDPTTLEEQQIYNLMMGTILPRPIAWVSTINADGKPNLAPFSYFMGVCCIPMTILFCPVVPVDRIKKDTLINLEEVPEFVVNIATENNASAVNMTAIELPYGESEFALTGMTEASSQVVRPPRVLEAPISFECTVKNIIEISSKPGGGWIVIGNVERVHIQDNLLDLKTFQVPIESLQPIARLGGNHFLRATDTFSMRRLRKKQELEVDLENPVTQI